MLKSGILGLFVQTGGTAEGAGDADFGLKENEKDTDLPQMTPEDSEIKNWLCLFRWGGTAEDADFGQKETKRTLIYHEETKDREGDVFKLKIKDQK